MIVEVKILIKTFIKIWMVGEIRVFAAALRMWLKYYYLTFNVWRSAFWVLYSKHRKPSYLNLQVFETSNSFSMNFTAKTVQKLEFAPKDEHHAQRAMTTVMRYSRCASEHQNEWAEQHITVPTMEVEGWEKQSEKLQEIFSHPQFREVLIKKVSKVHFSYSWRIWPVMNRRTSKDFI